MSAQQVKLLLVGLAEYLQVTLTPAQVLMYSEEFSDARALGEAIKILKKDPEVRPGKFPLPAQINKYLTASADSDAKETVALIFECVQLYGNTKQAAAKAHMGDFAWAVCKRYGSFGNLCLMETHEKPAIYAQLRDMASNMITRARLGLGRPEVPLALIEEREDAPRAARRLADTRSEGAEQIGGILLALSSKQNTEPGAG